MQYRATPSTSRGRLQISRLECVQNAIKPKPDDHINQRKEKRHNSGHDQHHDRGQRHLAARRPDNFADFGTHLLEKLYWVGSGHNLSFGGIATHLSGLASSWGGR